MGLTELLAALEAEHAALEQVLFKLREQYLVLSSGEHRWLPRCTAEVDAALAGLTQCGRHRESVAAEVHAALGLPPGASLGDVANRVDDELACQVLHQWRRRLGDQLDQVRRSSRANRELLAQGMAATTDALAMLGSVPTYDATGAVAGGTAARVLFDGRA